MTLILAGILAAAAAALGKAAAPELRPIKVKK
jgi:hypothetical protein